jgi:hypothetical protein
MKSVLAFIVIWAMFAMLAIPAAAVDPVPLPDVQLTAVDGSTVKTAGLPSQGNWILIYVQPRNQFSDNLLRLLKREQYPTLAEHTVIVVGGSVDDLKGVQSRYPDLATASWYADTNKSAFTTLKLSGAPTILGIKQKTIAWSLSGVLKDVNVSKSILNTWVQG